jgi:hypothetical protein
MLASILLSFYMCMNISMSLGLFIYLFIYFSLSINFESIFNNCKILLETSFAEFSLKT